MKKQPLVSVIIPTKNSQEFLKQCLESVLAQTYKNIEIIIVDNYSTDKTKEIVESQTVILAKAGIQSKIFFFLQGPERSAQRNYGEVKARGKYVYFVDSDFILNKKVINECVNKIEDYDALVVHNTPDEKVSWIAKIRKFEVDMYKYDLTHSAARFFEKKVFKKIGGYDEQITAGEDYDIQNRLNKGGYKTGFIKAEAIHLGEPRSFWKHMSKYFNYGRDFTKFEKKNKKESQKQLVFFRNIYFKNWKKFVSNPIGGFQFLFYNCFKYMFAGIGYFYQMVKEI